MPPKIYELELDAMIESEIERWLEERDDHEPTQEDLKLDFE